MASGWDLNYDQFRSALDSVAGAGKNDWSAPDSGALALQMAGGKTWNPSGAGSGVTYHPATPAGGYQYDENGNLQLLPPGHWSADHTWRLDTPQLVSEMDANNEATGRLIPSDIYATYNTQPIQQAAKPESWTVSGDMSALLGQPGSNQHADVTYVKQGNQLVPLNAPTSWKYEGGNGIMDAIKGFAPMAMALVAPELAPALAGALGVSNATAAMILSAGTNVAVGQDPLKAIENAAIAYTGTAAAGQVASQLASSGLDQAMSSSLGNAAGSALTTAAKGGDPLQALLAGGIGMGTSALADQIPGFSDLPAAAQKAITTTMASELQGKDPTQALISQALNAGVNAAKSYSPNVADSFYDPATNTSPVNAADIGTGGGTTSPTWNPADFPVQDFGTGALDQYNAEYQKNLQDLASSGGYTSQWAPGSDGTHTLTNDDGSTITVDASGNVTGTTNATDTPYAGTPAAKTTSGLSGGSTTGGTAADTAAAKGALPAYKDPEALPGGYKTVGKAGYETPEPGLKQLYGSLMGVGATPATTTTATAQNPINIQQETLSQMQNTNPDLSPYYARGGLVSHFADGGSALEAVRDASDAADRKDLMQSFANLGAVGAGVKPPPHNLVHLGQVGAPYQPKVLPQLAALLQARGMHLADGGQPEHPDDHKHPNYDGSPVFRTGGLDGLGGKYVEGKGDGTSDDISAMLANGEYVFSADVVSALGNGSNKAGADKLGEMVKAIRERARSAPADKLPPDAKSPLEYLKSSKGKKNG